MNNVYYIMIALGVVILLVPVQQSTAIFLPSPELTEDELIELYKLEQLVNAEHARDEIFALAKEKNPYLDSPADVQVSIAEEKCKEILGEKTILNSINDEPTQKKTILGFKIDSA